MAGSGVISKVGVGAAGVVNLRSKDGEWTDPDDYADFDTKRVFVASDAADDSANGLTAATPKKTIAAGMALLRPGFPDQLLLKRGLTWTNQKLYPWQAANGQAL